LTKAANDTVGLVLSVHGVAEEVAKLDEMLGSLDDRLMLIGLEADDQLTGIVAVNMELRAAVLEMETMGALLGQPAEERSPTRTDKTLCDPLIDAFLLAFPSAVVGTPLEGWLNGCKAADKLESTRAAGLILADGDYRIVRMTVDLGVAERQGELVIALPVLQADSPAEVPTKEVIDWGTEFRAAVEDAPAGLTAQLHRFDISLATAQSLKVGSVLPLTGCTVSSVVLLAPDGKRIAQAKLGQSGGYRAVRLEAAPAPQLSDLPSVDEQASPLVEPSSLPNIAEHPEAVEGMPDPMVQLTDDAHPSAMSPDLTDNRDQSQVIDPPSV